MRGIEQYENSIIQLLDFLAEPYLEYLNLGYFRDLFAIQSSPHSIPITFPWVISREMNEWLTQQPLGEEGRTTLFSFAADKSPGPDEFTSECFRKFWPEIKETIMQCVQFFRSKVILNTHN